MPMLSASSPRLITHLIVTLLTAFILVSLAGTYLKYQWHDEQRQALIKAEHERIEHFLLPQLELIIEKGRFDELDVWLARTHELHPDLVALHVFDATGNPVGFSDNKDQREGVQISDLTLGSDERLLGRLEIVWNTDDAEQRYLEFLWRDLELGVLKVLVFALLIYVLLNYFVIKPLVAMIHYTSRLTLNQHTDPPNLCRVAELQLLRSTVEDMHASLVGHQDLSLRLNQSEAMNTAMVRTSLDAIVSVDVDGNIVEFNPAAERIFGYTREQVMGESMADLIIPENMRAEHVEGMARFVQTNKDPVLDRRIEFYAMNCEGEEFPVELSISATQLEQGLFFTAFIRDISERKQAEADLLESTAKAEQANEAKGRFLATMSHEIRTPLNAIINMNALMLDMDLQPEARQFARTAHDGGQLLLSLINNVLDYSKIEADKLELHEEWLDLSQLAQETAELMSAQARTKGLELCLVVEPELPQWLYADAMRLQQILVNLIGNGIKFTDAGGVQVRIEMGEEEWVLSVSDTGIGIPQSKQEELFNEFVQLKTAKYQQHQVGTGLGLAISQRLVQLMGGEIRLHSEVGRGARFDVYLPLPRKTPTPWPTDIVNTLAHTQLLLVTQNAVLGDSLQQQLAMLGLSLKVYESWEEAQGHLKPTQAARVLLDDGVWSPTQPIEYPRLAQLDFIALVSMCAPGVVEIAKQAGFSVVLRKPIRLQRLLMYLAEPQQHPSQSPSDRVPVKREVETNSANVVGHVLLVEDSVANQMVAKTMLERDGLMVSVVQNGQEAVDFVQSHPVDLVLMDLTMPVMDGITAAAHIRALPGPEHELPIIAMTANALASDRERCLEVGMNAYLSKPVDARRLHNTVRDFLGLAGAAIPDPQEQVVEAGHSLPLVSEAVLAQLLADTSADVFQDLVDIYIQESSERIERMQSLWQAKDWVALGDEAHTLKSGSGTFGLLKIQALARDLEMAAKASDAALVNESMQQVLDLVPSACEQLQRQTQGLLA